MLLTPSKVKLTALGLFRNRLLLQASNGLLGTLSLELTAPIAAAPGIKRTLQGIALPAKDVVTVLAITGTGVFISWMCDTGDRKGDAYPSPIEYTRGCPFSGQMLLSLNGLVSHITSYINCGKRTGWLAGHGPVDSKEPVWG